MKLRRTKAWLVVLAAAAGLASGQPATAGHPPAIKHEPVTVSVRGQPIMIRAIITVETGAVKTVRLHYALSKDMAPIGVAMQAAGGGSYYAAVSGAILESAGGVSYYIEAIDEADGTAETPWYTVKIQAPSVAVPGGAAVGGDGPPAPGEPEKQGSWVKPALIAGGVALAVGGGVALAVGGGGGGGGGGGTATTNTGTYAGTVTTSLEMQGASAVSSSHPATFVVVSSGVVSSDDLQTGQHLEANLSGTSFSMTAPVNDHGLTGSITYNGSLINSRILGSVGGSVASNGVSGAYSGTFTATKR